MRRLLATVALLALALSLGAQEPPAPGNEDFRVRVKVDLVTAPLVVRDRSGEFVYDLRRDEVVLYDNGVPQQLISFELAVQPVSLVVLVDTSKQIAPLLDRIRPSGILFTSYILGQTGEAAVITFDSDVVLRQDFTSDDNKVIEAIRKVSAGGTKTRLADALDQAVRLLMERTEGRRRVIVAITEPDDDGSQVAVGMPLRRAQLAEISVYTISLNRVQADLLRRPEDVAPPPSPFPPGVFPTPGIPGQVQTPTTEANRQYARVDLLNAIRTLVTTLRNTMRQNVLEVYAQGSGALHYSPNTQRGLEDAVQEIGTDLHTQYLVSYRPTNRDARGFHRVEIDVRRPGVSVRTRPGYYVGPPVAE